MVFNVGMKVISFVVKLMFYRGNSLYNLEVFFVINNYYMYIYSFYKIFVFELFN